MKKNRTTLREKFFTLVQLFTDICQHLLFIQPINTSRLMTVIDY